jgi:hypothetical protein
LKVTDNTPHVPSPDKDQIIFLVDDHSSIAGTLNNEGGVVHINRGSFLKVKYRLKSKIIM